MTSLSSGRFFSMRNFVETRKTGGKKYDIAFMTGYSCMFSSIKRTLDFFFNNSLSCQKFATITKIASEENVPLGSHELTVSVTILLSASTDPSAKMK